MRTLIRSVLVAVALTFAVPAAPALAQASQRSGTAHASWTVIEVRALPSKVSSAQRRVFPRTRITKVERSGTGKAAIYRVTMSGKNKMAKFDAAGTLIK
jgi:hypothetical protein